ncbi:zinc-binding dehydrogenase [Frankia sp. Mgl5]|uniref:alcohol dehydrogenase catalytic domain-containing protein n=1 Tax=Frankia sp. Mgl5 TaxID=2933793 RepID=UPI00200CF0CB|nr:zinc-binding dehydrogenase [Frankia sp. Mgl5]MCK9930650.1 zinc-binding dehydrogenase [Frankia sp. Mgl5]
MRAVVIAEQGAQPAATELPTQKPGTGEVLVRVAASSVNGFDLAVAGGLVAGMIEHRFPLVLGKDFAGTVGFGADQHPAATAVMANPTGTTLDRLAGDVAAGRLRVPVARMYPLAEVPAAFGDFAGGTMGKLAVAVV